jgi:hypothetical protein
MREQQRQAAARAERPIAQLTALLFNINKTKDAKVLTERDWWIYGTPDDARTPDSLSPATVAAMLSLRAERHLPDQMLAAWHLVQAQADAAGRPPECRALRSDCGRLWVIAPTWEGSNIRGGLVGAHGIRPGLVTVRDLDRPLLTYRIKLPPRSHSGWLEADLLLGT